MIKIGITGSIASGKTTASKILSYKRGPLFSADNEVHKLYKNDIFKKLLIKEFKIEKKSHLKDILIKKIIKNKKNIKKLEKIIHPIIRNQMKRFVISNKKKEKLFFEIPLLFESKLMNYFDIIIFVKANKRTRLKRFKDKGGDNKLFNLLNKKQLSNKNKEKFSNHIVVNEKNLNILKKKLLDIIKLYV